MKILIIGASHGTGALAVAAALARGHEVTAFARSPDKLRLDHPKLRRITGDFHDPASVAAAIPGHDAVLVTAFPGTLGAFKKDPTFFSRGTAHVVEAMKQHGVKRIVILSAFGAGDSRAVSGFILGKLIIPLILKAPYADHDRQEQLVQESGLDWVFARPTRLTDGPARKKYVKTAAVESVPSFISRADVADFLVEAAESDRWVRRAVQLGG